MSKKQFNDYINYTRYFMFLDELRELGSTNMYGAGSYLQDDFSELSYKQANEVLLGWMRTFNEDLSPATRAQTFIDNKKTS